MPNHTECLLRISRWFSSAVAELTGFGDSVGMDQAFAQSRLGINDLVWPAQIVGQGASSSDFGRKQQLRIEQVLLHRKIVC